MPCSISCAISGVFVIGMIYFYHETNNVVKQYRATLSKELQQRYNIIASERRRISYQGYMLGLLFSFAILYNRKMNTPWVCTTMMTCFLTNYLYYKLYPKSDWMLNHVTHPDQVRAWLDMYRQVSYHYHVGVGLGILAVGMITFAFC
jgi:hypothetical protein